MELTEIYARKKDFHINTRNSQSNDSVSSSTMTSKEPPPVPPIAPAVEDFDFVAARVYKHKPTTVLDSTGHLVKGCLGGGILGIPEAVMKAGLWTGAVFTIIFGVYVAYCIHILVSSAQILYVKLKITYMSYSDLAEHSVASGPFPKYAHFGKCFRYFVDFVICIDLYGSCCCYFIIIGKTAQQLTSNTDPEVDKGTLRLYILACLIPILILCMITSLKYLAPFSIVADFFVVVCVIATVVYSWKKAPKLSERPAFKDFIGFFEFCGVVVFSMEGIGVSLPIENEMKEPKKFPIVLVCGYAIVVSGVLITGFFGYWGFGEGVVSPVTLNFPNDLFPTLLKAMIALVIYVTFALNFYPPFHLCWFYLAKKYPPEKHWFWERVYRAIFVVIICGVAVAFPDVGNMMGLIGAFCLSNMGFIFPAIIDTLIIWHSPGFGPGRWRLWKNIFIAVLGFILLISGTYTNGKALLGFKSKEEKI